MSYRDVEELLAERGIEVDHVTVYRWVLRFTPLLAEAARPCRHQVGDRWQVDETYMKVAGRWRYVYRAIDQAGQVIDVFVSPRRDATAACRFFERAIRETKTMPVEVVTDLAPVYPATLEELLPGAWHRTDRCRPGRPRKRPAKLHGDNGYDYPRCRRALRRRGITPRIARRGIESSERLGCHRYVVERSLAWLVGCRWLQVRYERHADILLGFVSLACALICLNLLNRPRGGRQRLLA